MASKNTRNTCLILVTTIIMALLFATGGLVAYYVGKKALTIFGRPDTNIPSKNKTDSPVIIIGAGLSGIAAAKTLHEAGIDFVILEAADRIGGRLKEYNFSGTIIETGGSWIQGIKDNPIKKIADKINLKGIVTDEESYVFVNATGSDVTNQADAEYNRFTRIVETISTKGENARKNAKTVDMSLRSSLGQHGWFATKAIHHAMEIYDYDFEIGCIPARASVKQNTKMYTDIDFGEDDFFVTDQRGFAEIVRYQASQFLTKDDKRLHLSETVKSVRYGKSGVQIRTNKGIYDGSFALSTVSLGVLQQGIIEFNPPLPEWKRTVLHKELMVDTVLVYLKFATVFWHEKQFILHVHMRRGFYPILQNVNLQAKGVHPSDSNILVMNVFGPEARRISRLPDRVIQHEVLSVLGGIYGSNVTDLLDIYISRWSTDSKFMGAWANWPFGLNTAEFKALKAPLHRLYFAGDAMSEKYYGMTHGAHLEGIQQAKDIIKCMQVGNCPVFQPLFQWPK